MPRSTSDDIKRIADRLESTARDLTLTATVSSHRKAGLENYLIVEAANLRTAAEKLTRDRT